MDDKILILYAKGMTTREIVDTFKEMYDADVSASLISEVTDAVLEQVIEWQARPLDAIYPIETYNPDSLNIQLSGFTSGVRDLSSAYGFIAQSERLIVAL